MCNKCRILINTSLAAGNNLQLCVCMFWMCSYLCKSANGELLQCQTLFYEAGISTVSRELFKHLFRSCWTGHLSLLSLSVDSSKAQYLPMAADVIGKSLIVWEMEGGSSVAGSALSLHQLVDHQHTKFELLGGRLASDTILFLATRFE